MAEVEELAGRRQEEVSEAPVRVVLLGLPPVYRHGLMAGLSAAGFDCAHRAADVRPTELLGAAHALMLGADRATELLPALAGAGLRAAAVLVVDRVDARTYADALRVGATGVVGIEDELPQVVRVVRAAAEGQTLMPRDVARSLCRPLSGPPPQLSATERGWLLVLADSGTVAALARRAGYSEREMYRLLAGVYGRLGASNRTEALLNADRWGLLDRDGGA